MVLLVAAGVRLPDPLARRLPRPENLRGMLGLLPEMGLVAIGVTILMICGEFDLSVGSVFALMPMSMAMLLDARRALRACLVARAR